MTTLTRYIVPCLTENVNVFTDYRETVPTACPNNNTHTIDANNIKQLDSTTTKTLKINQNGQYKTGGYYKAKYFQVDLPSGTGSTGSCDVTFPYNIAAYSTTFLLTNDNVGDTYGVVSIPDTYGGLISATVATGATGLSLYSVASFNPGFTFKLTDGVNTNDLGEIISVDYVNKTVTFTNSTSNSFDMGSHITFSVPRIVDGIFVNDQNVDLGFSVVSSSGLAAGAIVRVNCTNNNGIAKKLNFLIELQF